MTRFDTLRDRLALSAQIGLGDLYESLDPSHVRVRHVLCYLARYDLGMSQAEVARALTIDRTSVRAGVEKIARSIDALDRHVLDLLVAVRRGTPAPGPMRRIYVAAPSQDASFVDVEVHAQLRERGFVPTSTWAAKIPQGGERLDQMPAAAIRHAIEENDLAIAFSDAMLVLARLSVGGEMFAEAALADRYDIPRVWVGRLTLGAFREGVTRVATLDEAIAALCELRDRGRTSPTDSDAGDGCSSRLVARSAGGGREEEGRG